VDWNWAASHSADWRQTGRYGVKVGVHWGCLLTGWSRPCIYTYCWQLSILLPSQTRKCRVAWFGCCCCLQFCCCRALLPAERQALLAALQVRKGSDRWQLADS